MDFVHVLVVLAWRLAGYLALSIICCIQAFSREYENHSATSV